MAASVASWRLCQARPREVPAWQGFSRPLGHLEGTWLNVDCPNEQYVIKEKHNIGILKLALHRESRQKRAILTLPKRTIPVTPGTEEDHRQAIRKHLSLLLKIRIADNLHEV